jgi:hypothetical protein
VRDLATRKPDLHGEMRKEREDEGECERVHGRLLSGGRA